MQAQRCPICDMGTLKKECVSETFEYKGRKITIPDYIKYRCSECREAIVDNDTLRESGKILSDFKRQVDGLLTGEQIKAVRSKLGFTQEELAEIIGGGLKSVARYESGQVCQSRGMDNLLRILDAYPETLKVIQRGKRASQSEKVVYMVDRKNRREYVFKGPGLTNDIRDAVYGS
ncbi:MAG: type II toxin-antitoxin system MqsA family antitoxin [Thermodesulfovibrionales bacterium]